ncbi:MAG TPA: zinc-binding dehydrogenase [Ktedonobacteraceae bacterium]|nr:zinc-binding dehydrogenase [Ktedonobacteraceae bacterium]
MKAAQFDKHGGPEVLQVREVPDPIPASNEVLIDVKATSVNRLDLFQRQGSRPVPKLPFTPGLEAAGVVVQDSNGFRAGDRVLTTRAAGANGGGGFASRIAAPADGLARIPDQVSFEQAAAAGLASSTAWSGLFDNGNLKPNERVLIWAGSSGVGSIALQIAHHFGAWVATTASSAKRAEELKRLGADLVINPKEQNVGQELQNVGGVDLVLELIGTTLQDSIDACKPEGRVVLIGNLSGHESTVNTQTWRLKRVRVLGGGLMHTSPANEEQVLRLIAEKVVTPLIAHTLPLEQAAEAHRLQEQSKHQGKIIVVHS